MVKTSSLGIAAAVAALVSMPGSDMRARAAAPAAGQAIGPPLRVGARSPLAVNRIWLFAVAEDNVTLLRQSLSDEGPWRPLPALPDVGRIAGLAATDTTLYVSDAGRHRILTVNLETGQPAVYAQLPELSVPTDLAFTTSLFFADASRPEIFQWSDRGARPLSPPSGRQTSSPKYLASDGNVLLLASPDDGAVWQIVGAPVTKEPPARERINEWAAIQRPSLERGGPELPVTLDVAIAGQVSFPLRPTAVAAQRGVTYVIDGNTGELYALSRYWPRPVRLRFAPRAVKEPARLAVTPTQLLILDSATRKVERWPRLTPTRVSCSLVNAERPTGVPVCSASQYAAFARFFAYLNAQQYLPMKHLPGSGPVAEAVDREYSTVTMKTAITRIACAIDRPACGEDGNRFLPTATAAAVNIPDIYGESYVDVAQILLDGSTTLGQVADASVPSRQFGSYKTEERLAQLNASIKVSPNARYALLATGTASAPVEVVRFVVGIPEESLYAFGARFPELTFVSLGESSASRAATSPVAPQPPDPDPAGLIKAANAQLRASIGGPFQIDLQSYPYVGVAESDIDLTNGDIADAFSTTSPVRASGTPPPPAPAGVTIREFRPDDHGTAVSSLIVAHPAGLDPALGSGLMLLKVDDTMQNIGESIRQAYVNQLARIFNLSFHYGKSDGTDNTVPKALKEAIEQYSGALFVVAAGNDTITAPDGNVCATFDAYPVCWGDRQNVLVVTATTLDGTTLLQPDRTKHPQLPGANWNPNVVHVAAPGEGYYASGRGNGYVKVRGTSFATPLVTATAALLYAQGVRNPWEIKQRIVATADKVAGLTGFVAYGRLNARRAVTNLAFAVAVDELPREHLIALDQAGALVPFSSVTADFTVPLANIRRLTRIPGSKYELLYLDGDQLKRTIVRQRPWPFRYYEFDPVKHKKTGPIPGDLTNYVDYVGPIL